MLLSASGRISLNCECLFTVSFLSTRRPQISRSRSRKLANEDILHLQILIATNSILIGTNQNYIGANQYYIAPIFSIRVIIDYIVPENF